MDASRFTLSLEDESPDGATALTSEPQLQKALRLASDSVKTPLVLHLEKVISSMEATLYFTNVRLILLMFADCERASDYCSQ